MQKQDDTKQADLALGVLVNKLRKDAFDFNPDDLFGNEPKNGLFYYSKLITEWGDIPLDSLKGRCTPELYEAGHAFIAATLTLIEIYIKRLSVFVDKKAPSYFKSESDAYNTYDIEMEFFDKEIKTLGSLFADKWFALYPDETQNE